MTFGDMFLLNRLSSLKLRLDPIRDAKSGEIVGREARWEIVDGDRVVDVNRLLRDDCAPEEHGLIDRWALRRALQAIDAEAPGDPATLHVDVRSVVHADHAVDFYQWLRNLGSELRNVAVEIDERFVRPHRDTFAGFARAVRRIGLEIAVDHARNREGTQEVLRMVQCDAIKIEASLVACIATDTHARETVRDIVRFAHSCGMYAVAMGVHGEEMLERVRDLGCDRVQVAGLPTSPRRPA
jgi:EAL domain-containing protein (putative c-di-GMP-specific phosphodiesterase class I)